jgi:hypothetical protein
MTPPTSRPVKCELQASVTATEDGQAANAGQRINLHSRAAPLGMDDAGGCRQHRYLVRRTTILRRNEFVIFSMLSGSGEEGQATELYDFRLLANRGITGGRTRAVEIKVGGVSNKQIRGAPRACRDQRSRGLRTTPGPRLSAWV